MIEKCEELWLMLIINIIHKRNDSANILLCAVHDWVSVLFNLSLLGSENILKRLVE